MKSNHTGWRRGRSWACMALGVFASASAQAQGWPAKPISLVTAGAPGDGLDVISRALAQGISRALGQTLIVDNRPGAGGKIAMLAVKNAPGDGYTIGAMSLNNIPLAAVNAEAGYDPVKDYAPISLAADAIPMLVVAPSLQVKTVQELIAHAKANPGKLNYGSSGVGSIFHFYAEWLRQMAGINIVHVPYKGEVLALNDIVNGRIHLMFASGISKPFVQGGKLVLVGTAGPQRMADFPGTATMAESGLAEFVVTGWIGLVAPVGTPGDIVAKLNGAVARAVVFEEVKKLLNNFTFVERGSSAEEFGQKIRVDVERLRRIGRAGNIVLE
ncbi:MAG: tripartite tricarboxylate transporter substrate binding protein [Betaproteobacteria bacterium]|nr:tripartite tricarboxylate transporter substrate binding protein [Betaproteobacteria bacterium]